MPHVTVTATHLATGALRTTVTSEAGEYQWPNFEAGPYAVLFRLDGFADTTHEVTVLARQVVGSDMQL